MSRAMKILYLSCPKVLMGKKVKLSPFLDEIIDHQDLPY